MNNFWKKMHKPIYALAPMAGVTDSAFRQMCKSFGADVVYSEMISAAAIFYNSKKTLELMEFDKKERPFVIQLFGSNPEHFAYATKYITEKIKPDGIDINFGCPVKKVAKQGAGAILMDNLKLAREIIEAVINNTNLPVSLKIRSKVKQTTALDFLKYLADLDIKAIMIHGRTVNQCHSGPVDYDIIKQARKFFKGIILANGGVKNVFDANNLLEKTKADGIGIGQGAIGNPWIFKEVKSQKLKVKSDREELFKIILKHAKLAQKLKGEQGIIEMRKHLCSYVKGLKDASDLKKEFVKIKSLSEIKNILQPFFLFKK
ncbi:tRNA-dihydrouridine synthase [Patescibacteria group bacterium]|nr:tRNA-dihydrouridine synthase [Patescibacteria group bacterium]MBU0879485.1 tRNA-dihydrouridine synthase [Patescibacteria group bacterium]MBU0879997.1 tRNA-dihydrouridine synthase [Patescibacteria group bacterium]MBU1783384.1 tRNA-dihydrouridine synthase [Patescibacteria group bacterium]MBU1991619.1 tRNA-dihydrouridine synthase [Patescibacteria group bacterium]